MLSFGERDCFHLRQRPGLKPGPFFCLSESGFDSRSKPLARKKIKMSTNTAEDIKVEDGLVESTETETETEETEEVSVIELVVAAISDFGSAENAKQQARETLESEEKKSQEALTRLYELTDEGATPITLPHGKWRVRKRRGRTSGYLWEEAPDNSIDLTGVVDTGDDEDE